MDVLTRFGLTKTRFTYLLMIIVIGLGVMSYQSLPKREDPAITIRTATAVVTFEGMSPERIEDLIAIPIERKIREIGAVENIETVITAGQALFYVYLFDATSGVDIAAAWEDLRNKMDDAARELPEGSVGPFVNTDFGDVSVATIAVTGDGLNLAEIKDAAEDLQRGLYRLDGVTSVALSGAQEERIWLDLDNRKLASVGVQLTQVLEDLAAQNVILPAGEIEADGSKIVLEANGDLETVDDIRGVLTKVSGLAGYVRLSDLVTVRRGFVDPKEKPVFFNGEPAIIASVEMSNDTDIQKLGRTMRTEIQRLEAQQPIGVSYTISTLQETAVTNAVNGALSNVAQTFIVVFVVMMAFLGVRAATVIACIVPFTVMFALMNMSGLGVDIEQVSIAAVIISLGLLVDNGLVVVEDIEGRINAGAPAETAAREAGAQYVVPLGVASVTTVSAFIPMLMIDGVEGEFAYSLGAVVAVMLLGSWLTALYVLPFLAVQLLRPKATGGGRGPLVAAYGAVIRRLLPFGAPILGVTAALVVAGASLFAALKPQMFPMSERTEVLIYMSMPKGAALAATEAEALSVQAYLADKDQHPEVASTTIYVGDGGPRFYLSLDPAIPDPTTAFFVVNAVDYAGALALEPRIRRALIERFPTADFRVTRLSSGGSESGLVDVEIFGPDAETLLAAAAKVMAGFADAPQIVKNEMDWGDKVIKIVVDIAQDKAREFGVTSEEISDVMNAYFSGATYSIFREDDEQIPIVLRAAEPYRDSIEDFVNLSIAANGALISIDQVADFKPRLEYSELRRENQVRRIVISAKSDALEAQKLANFIQPTLDELNLGPDYTVNIAGELEDSEEVYGKIGANMPIALAVMLLALVFQFNSARRTIITFLTIPIILIGAPLALMIADRPMSFFAVLGLMSLMGIIINNAIVLINQVDIEAETKPFDDAVVSAAEQRARPIMLTSLTTIFGLIPMALTGGVLFEPMATIMIGGLLIASPLTLIIAPSLCYWFLRPRRSAPGDDRPREDRHEGGAPQAAAPLGAPGPGEQAPAAP